MAHSYNELPSKEEGHDQDSNADTQVSVLLDSQRYDFQQQPQQTSTRQKVLIVLFFLGSSFLTTSFGVWIGHRWTISPAWTMQYISSYSPIIKDVDMTYHTQRFNGSLLKTNAFRGDAGPEVDVAWQSIGVDYRSIVIPTNEAARSGLRPDQVKISEKYGGGYPANVEGLHQLHCLNLLRKSLFHNFEHYKREGHGPFSNPEHILKHHTTHCLDIIRQQLQCTVDVGVLGQVWWNKESPEAFVDFNTQHKCRDFEAVRSWAEQRQIPATVPRDFLEVPLAAEVLGAIP